ncbi:helix-turn-helix domain-containing protein [uncultured Tenacibaculum sp.]|uniref:winged helix-turn-helix transcriptional regulator n=1 Tax=uncultured Tenacibaculum sp. TaxID=174713 RepID=UPI00260B7CB7|nr:helix-turn-helix domain-containing protein [uncultured Tenacibaculum sp.]
MEDKDVQKIKVPLKEHFGNYMVPVRDALEVFSGKWKIPIITALSFYETCGFKELERIIEGITPKMLSKELKYLETNLLITRKVENTRPVTVTYSITEYGKTCSTVMTELYRWGVEHRKKVFNIEGQTWDKC